MSAPISTLLGRLDKVRSMGRDKWAACCPAHDDRTPSLSISKRGGSIALHCFAGCATEDVLAAVGLSFRDLYSDPLTAAREAAVSNKGRKFEPETDLRKVDMHVLKIARRMLEQGQSLSIEDAARVELAKERLREGA